MEELFFVNKRNFCFKIAILKIQICQFIYYSIIYISKIDDTLFTSPLYLYKIKQKQQKMKHNYYIQKQLSEIKTGGSKKCPRRPQM